MSGDVTSKDTPTTDTPTTQPTSNSSFLNDERRWPWLLRVSLPAGVGALITVLMSKALAESPEDQQRREEAKAQAVGKETLVQSREALYQKLQAMYLELDAAEIGSRRRVLDTIESEFAGSNPKAEEFVSTQRKELARAEEMLGAQISGNEAARSEYEQTIRELRRQVTGLEAQLLQVAGKDDAKAQAVTRLLENKQKELERLEKDLKDTKQALADANKKPTSGPGGAKPCTPPAPTHPKNSQIKPEPKPKRLGTTPQ